MITITAISPADFARFEDRVIEYVVDRVAAKRDIPADSDVFEALIKSAVDAATNTYVDDITIDDWQDRALCRVLGIA